MKMEPENRTLATARHFIKVAEGYAKFKRTEGYIEDNYSLFEVINLDACMEIIKSGPADFYYEKAYQLMCKELGVNHPETHKLVQEIISYHVNNVKRMMLERYVIVSILITPFLWLLKDELYGKSWQGAIALLSCYSLLGLAWFLETTLVCFFEKRYRQTHFMNE